MSRLNDIDFERIGLLVLDVDGVLTDGRITLTASGEELKSYHVRDGSGMKYWKRVGRQLAIISGRGAPAVTRRAEELGVETVRLNIKNKLPVLREVAETLGFTLERVAVVGDDLTDLPMVRECGFGVAVADAVDELKAAADHVTELAGGCGCVREVIELMLRRAGLWERVLERYMPGGEAT